MPGGGRIGGRFLVRTATRGYSKNPVARRPVPQIRRIELAEFADFLSVMLDEGVSLPEAIAQCAEPFAGGPVGILAARIAQGLSEGHSLSQTLRPVARRVDRLFIRSVVIGEYSGNLAAAMRRMSAHLRQQEKLRRRLLGSITYPCTILACVLAALLLLLWLLFPRLEEISQSGNPDAQSAFASLAGRIRLETGVGMSLLVIAGTMAAASGRQGRGGALALRMSRIVLSLPYLGRTASLGQFNLFLSGLETLTGTGVPLGEALSDAALLLTNPVLNAALSRACEKVKAGESVSRAMASERWVPSRIAQSLSIAEQTGKVEEIVGSLRSLYEWEYGHRLERLSRLAEPALLGATGLGLAVVVTTIFLPLLDGIAAAAW